MSPNLIGGQNKISARPRALLMPQPRQRFFDSLAVGHPRTSDRLLSVEVRELSRSLPSEMDIGCSFLED